MTAVIRNPLGAFAGSTTDSSHASIIQAMSASTTVSRGQVVAFAPTAGSALQVILCLTNTTAKAQAGIAMEDIPAGSEGLVCLYGPCDFVLKGTSAMTAQDVAQRDSVVTGSVVSLVGTTAITQLKDSTPGIGLVLADKTAGDASVSLFVCKL